MEYIYHSEHESEQKVAIDLVMTAQAFGEWPQRKERYIRSAYAKNTILARELWFGWDEANGLWAFFGGDGIKHGLKPDELVYIVLEDLEQMTSDIQAILDLQMQWMMGHHGDGIQLSI